MEKLDVFRDAQGSDQTIYGRPDSKTPPATGSVDPGGMFERCKVLHPQERIEEEHAFCSLKFGILPDPLKDFAEDQVCQR
jgi:hypothetical protein